MQPRLIKAEGPLSARIIFLGESPWKTENEVGRPFVGASGNLAGRWWGELGIRREELRIDNVYPYMPPQPAPPGDRLASVPTDTLVWWMRNLHERIAELKDPYVIVPTGNYATFALIGKGKVPARIYKALGMPTTTSEAEKRAGITSLRGSIYEYVTKNGAKCKVIPTIHPAGVLQSPKWERRSILDWKRIILESQSHVYDVSHRYINTDPSVYDIQALYQHALDTKCKICIDIETWGNTLSCAGFSIDATHATVLPMPNKSTREAWLPWVKLICSLPNEKILQFGLYDLYWLRWYGIDVNNYIWDVGAMHHCLDPVEEHKLEYLTSIFTRQPYYKDEAKDAEELIKFVKDTEALYHYNGLDCCVPHEIFSTLYDQLQQQELLQFYLNHYAAMYQPLLDTMLHGMRVDVATQKVLAKEFLKQCDKLREELKEAAGEELYTIERIGEWRKPKPDEWHKLLTKDGQLDLTFNIMPPPNNDPPKPKYINREVAKELGYVMSRGEIKYYTEKPKKDFSEIKMKKFFYETLGIPKQKSRKTKKTTLDEKALKTIQRKYPRKVGDNVLRVLRHRRLKKEHEIVKGGWDGDQRIRCSYKLTTDAGRLASSKNPRRKGRNLQNVKRGPMRETFLVDEGCVLVRIDESQIEDREVKMYTKQKRMIEMANLKPWEYDAHMENAKIIFGGDNITKEQRQTAKHVVHAAERDMHGQGLSDKVLKDMDIYIPPQQGQRMIDKFLDVNWEIRDIYFQWVRETGLRSHGILVNSWGRRIDFGWAFSMGRVNNELFRKWYSWYPQSECADILNQWGFIPAWQWLKQNLNKPPNAQVHDEVMASVPWELSYDYTKHVVDSLERPRMIAGAQLIVPAEVTLGLNWADSQIEFKRMPGRDEFLSKAKEVANA